MTSPWLESMYALVKSISFWRSSVMVKLEAPTSALPPCLMVGMMESNFMGLRYSHSSPIFLASACMSSTSKPFFVWPSM